MARIYKLYRNVSNVLFSILFVILLVYFVDILIYRVIYQDKLPRFFNYYVFNIVSGSMEDSIHVGDYIIVKKTSDFKVGDIVTYPKDDYYITHRIIAMNGDLVTTKGDANNVSDAAINKEIILGKFLFKSRVIGFLIKYRFVLISVLLLIYIVSYMVDNRNKDKDIKKEINKKMLSQEF